MEALEAARCKRRGEQPSLMFRISNGYRQASRLMAFSKAVGLAVPAAVQDGVCDLYRSHASLYPNTV